MTLPTGILPSGPLPPTSVESCEIMGPAGTMVQLIMGLVSFLTLAYKRTIESPKRDWKIWALDTSKQAISASLGHVLNVVTALIMAARVETISDKPADSCAWYLLSTIFGVAIGSFFNIALLVGSEKLFLRYKLDYLKSGNYFTEKNVENCTVESHKIEETPKVEVKHVYIDIDYLAWTLQLIIWCFIGAAVKIGLFYLQVLFSGPFGTMGTAILAFVNLKGLAKLIFVLVLVPAVLNAIQFWVTDNFLKKKVFTEKDFAAQSVYFTPNPRKKKGFGRSASEHGKEKLGNDVVIEFSRTHSPELQKIRIAHLYKPPEKTVEEKDEYSRRVQSF